MGKGIQSIFWKIGGINLITLTLALSLPGVGFSQQTASPEVRELRAMLDYTKKQLTESEDRRKELIKSLAESVRISEEQTFAAKEIEEKMEAFGVDLFQSSKDSLQQRLFKAVRDLHIARQESERQRKAIHELSEAFLKYIAATDAKENVKGEAREAIDKAGKSLSDLVDADSVVSKKLEKSQVVSVNKELGLVLLDAGRKTGVRVGTPITVNRNETPIFTALVVDVRESVCGALLQDRVGKSAGFVKVGDKIQPLVTETNF